MEANARQIAITAVAPIAWGSTYFVTRHYLPAGTPLMGAALRALPAGLLLWAVAPRLPRADWWWRTAVIALLTVGGFFVLVYVAGSRLPSSLASTLMATSAVGTMLFAWALLRERPRMAQWVGAGLGIVGVVILLGAAAGRPDLIGVLASIGGMVSSSLGFVLTKRWRPPVSPLTFAAWQLTFGGLMVLPVALLVEGVPTVPSLGEATAMIYLIVIATAVAYACWFSGLRQLPATTVGIVGLLNPLAGALLGVLLGGEGLGPLQILGAALVLLGVLVGVLRRGQDPTVAAHPAAYPLPGQDEDGAAGQGQDRTVGGEHHGQQARHPRSGLPDRDLQLCGTHLDLERRGGRAQVAAPVLVTHRDHLPPGGHDDPGGRGTRGDCAQGGSGGSR